MKPVRCSVRIDAPRERVFDVFTDLRAAPERIEGILSLEVLTDGPIGKGTRFQETRKVFGKEATETMEITAFDPPRSYNVEANSCGTHYLSRLDFKPDGGATVVEMTFDATPQTLFAKLMMKVMGKKMTQICTKAFEGDLNDLRKAIESGATAGATASGTA